MKTKQRTLAVLLALAVLLGGALALVNRSNAKAGQAASEAAEGSIPLSSFALADLEQIEYTYNGQTYTLDYASDSWTLEQDPAYHLDASACNTMRTALAELNAKRQLTAQSGEDYGLTDPQVIVRVTAAGQTTTLIFGAENTVTGDLYVQKEGDDAIYTVDGNKAACFELEKADLFGSFHPAGLTISALEQVQYTLAGGETVSLTAVSEPADSASSDSASSEESSSSGEYQAAWRLTDDTSAQLDDSRVQTLLSAVCSYVSGQITGADPAAYGFDKPLVTVRAVTADGTAVLTYASGTDGCYMMMEGDSSVYAVDLTIVQALMCSENDLKTE